MTERVSDERPADGDWGHLAHTTALAHLVACMDWDEEEGEVGDAYPASAAFCGCEDCVVREVLHAAWPVIMAAARSGDFDDEERRDV